MSFLGSHRGSVFLIILLETEIMQVDEQDSQQAN